MPTIDYKPAPTVKDFILSYDPAQLFYRWIVGPVGCLPADSEFLTPMGWKRMDSWSHGDWVAVYNDGRVFFEQAEYVKLPTSETFIRFDSGSLDMVLSPEHRILYDDYRGIRRVATATECVAHPSRRTIPTTFVLDRPDLQLTDAVIRLLIAFSADGHLPKAGHKAQITVRKERKKERLRQLFDDAGLKWSEHNYPGRSTETIFRFSRRGMRKELDWVWYLSSRQLALVVDECTRWDGLNEHTERRYYTTVKRNADAIQFAAHAVGLRAAIHGNNDDRGNERWKTCYTVQIRSGSNSRNCAQIRGETKISRVESVDGMKYCFHTSTGYFVVRHNNTIFITGNSGKTTGNFFKLAYMARLQNPWPDGIRRVKAVVVRNTAPQLRDTTISSWNYWFKDGQAGEWKETAKTFFLRFGDVECETLFRPLDTPDDIARVLSLEVTFAVVDEFVQIPREIIDALSARLGRFPPASVGGATNWGMWGSSNPDTEDNWWYDYLHHNLSDNARYFLQPSGLSPEAENLENLPGGRSYYENQAKGKSDAWVKQFIEAEWGFSAAGKPVVSTFRPELHVAKSSLLYNSGLPLVVGFDPGLAGSALIFGQQDLYGRLLVLGELVQSGYGAQRLIKERLKPYLAQRFPGAQVIIAPDPAAAKRGDRDEIPIIQEFRRFFDVRIETNNRLPLRLDAIDYFATRLVEGRPALQIDPRHCPMLIRALKGGWRYVVDLKKDMPKPEPEKNQYSHPGDGFGYLCRYFHRQSAREMRYGASPNGVQKPFVPPRFTNQYHYK